MKNIILTIATFLLFASAAFAQGSIEGTISDAKGKPVANVSVTIVGADGKPVATAKTDESGAYTFDGVASGKYKVVATTPSGYKPAFRDDIAVEDDNATTLDITLVAAVQAPVQQQPQKPVVSESASVDEIIAKHIDAIGGKDVISKIQSIYTETIVEIPDLETKGSVTILNGKGHRSEYEITGGKFVECLNDSGGWVMNGGSDKGHALLPEQYKLNRWLIYVGGELFDYAAKGSKAELLGKEGNLYKIKLTTRDAQVSIYYIDPVTYFITKLTKTGQMMGQSVEFVISYSDYKKTDFGFMVPYTKETVVGSLTTVGKVTKVEINKPVDPKIFEQPMK